MVEYQMAQGRNEDAATASTTTAANSDSIKKLGFLKYYE
jgi:hypothetical protein